MKTGWIVGIVTAWVILFIFGLICDQAWFNGATLGSLGTLMHPQFPASSIPIIGLVVGAITVLWDWIQALFTIIFLKFDFFSGTYMIFWYIFFLPAGIGVVVSLVITVMRGVPSQ
jgi:hypothetical protein